MEETRPATRREMVLTTVFFPLLAANVPRFSADKGQQVSCAVDHSKNEDVAVFHEIDDPIISENHFSQILPIEFGDDSFQCGGS